MGVTQAVSGLGFRAPVLEPVTDAQPGSREDACLQPAAVSPRVECD